MGKCQDWCECHSSTFGDGVSEVQSIQYPPHWWGGVEELASIRTLLLNSASELAMESSQENLANVQVFAQEAVS